MHLQSQDYPDASTEQRASNDLIKRIRKLRAAPGNLNRTIGGVSA